MTIGNLSDLHLGYARDLSGFVRKIAVHEVSQPAKVPRERYVILLHGFKVRGDQAEDAFDEFIRNAGRISSRLNEAILTLTWPGQGSYSRALGRVREAGEALADYIDRITSKGGRAVEVSIVAHSLGCRIVAEALNVHASRTALVKGERSTITVFLLAAAVPVKEMEPGGRLRSGIAAAAGSFVFHSASDWVLRIAFPLGETRAAPGRTWLPKAVGLKGEPSSGLWSGRENQRGFGHSDYWTSADVVNKIATYLRLADIRPLAIREADRQLGSRNLPGRRLPDR